ncbi:MAG: YbbR-like domain-containing protein [Candidatus Zixiibacteriota bacterium]
MKWLIDNFWLKLVALAMGLLIWLHVATEKMYNYELRLPVTKVDLKENHTLASPPPDSVTVTVSAKGKQLLRLNWRQQGVRISATKYASGHYTIPLGTDNTYLVNPTKNVLLDEIIAPATVDLDIDVESKIDVLVTPDLAATADDGFAVSRRIDAIPPRVSLYGPKSQLRGIATVFTERKELSGLRSSVTVRVPLVAPKGIGMRLVPDSTTLNIDVVPVKTRVYERLPIVVYNAPPNQPVTTYPSFIRVELTGPPEDIDLLNRNALTVSADYRMMNRTSVAPLKIDCPANFRVKKSSADSVKILIGNHADSGN